MQSQDQDAAVLEVLVIGAGFSGVCAGIMLKKEGIDKFRIYDKSAGPGGTWWHNTYPGAACDIPSRLYCYSFEPNPDWSRVYSPQSEIQAYIAHCVDKYGLGAHLQLQRTLRELCFDDATQLWNAIFVDGEVVRARHVINAAGGLHKPAYPAVPGREGFQGPTMHSATWDHAVDFAGKTVALVGSAASAIQIAPQLAGKVKQLKVFQRTPNYIVPRFDRAYTDKEQARSRRWPWLASLRRWFFFMRGELLLYPLVKTRRETRAHQRVRGWVNQYIDAVVKDPATREKLRPDYIPGCKRLLISDDFYRCLNRDNVALIAEGIERITENALVTADGREHPADIVVYATGFDIDGHILSIDVTGPGGCSLRQMWQDAPEAYEGVMVAGMPNYYMLTGPNTGVATTSVVYMAEQAMGYVLQCIRKAGSQQLIQVRPEAQKAYNDRIQADLRESVWAGNCQSWYKRPDGRIVTLYPYNARTFRRQHRRPRMQDFTLAARAA